MSLKTTNSPIDRVANPVLCRILSFLPQGDLLTSVSVNQRIREIVIARLSTPERLSFHFMESVRADRAKGRPEYAIMQRRRGCPNLLGVWSQFPSLEQWVKAREAVEGLRLSPHATTKGYALFCQQHPQIPDAFDVANIPRNLFSGREVFVDPRYFSIDAWNNRAQVIAKAQKYIADRELGIDPHAQILKFIPGIERSINGGHNDITSILFASKIVELFDKFIDLLRDPKIADQPKDEALGAFDDGLCFRYCLLQGVDAYNYLACGPFHLQHVLFRTLLGSFSETPLPAALILRTRQAIEEYRLDEACCKYFEANSDRLDRYWEELYYGPAGRGFSSLGFRGIAKLLTLMGLLVEEGQPDKPGSSDKKDNASKQ